jgi:hypothetical protein
MGLKTLVLAGTTLATITIGFSAPAFAAAAPFTASARTTAAVQLPAGDDSGADVSGLGTESPVCSALGTETIPNGEDVAGCLGATDDDD